jgi:ribosomal protein S12 methylthiotransferase accessory factor
MSLEITYINRRIEFLDAEYTPERQAQYATVTRLYNRTLGPVLSVNLFPPGPADLSMYGTSCAHTPAGQVIRDLTCKSFPLDVLGVPVGGKGASMRQAFLGALGEASERLLAIFHSSGVMHSAELATYSQLRQQGRRALGPSEIPLFAREQYGLELGFVPFEPDTPICWIEGRDLFTAEPVLAPAQLVLFYWISKPGEAKIGYATSGGLVFHPDRLQAILYGIYENIERDAINLRWYCAMPPKKVQIDLNAFLRRYAGLNHPRMSTPAIPVMKLLLNTVDIEIPVFTALTIDEARRSHLLLAGGGAWAQKERAMIQAIFEIGQMQIGYKLFPHAWDNIRPDSTVSELTDFYYATIYYGFIENLPKLDWYVEGGDEIPWDDVPTVEARSAAEEYEIVSTCLRRHGVHPVVFDISSACWPGLSVTKVFMPQLTLAHIPSHPYLGHPRYYRIPAKMKFADEMTFDKLTKNPLPFP